MYLWGSRPLPCFLFDSRNCFSVWHGGLVGFGFQNFLGLPGLAYCLDYLFSVGISRGGKNSLFDLAKKKLLKFVLLLFVLFFVVLL